MRGYRARCVALTGVCALIIVTFGLAGLGSPRDADNTGRDGGATLVAVQLGVDGAPMRVGVDKPSEQLTMSRAANQKWPLFAALSGALALAGLGLARWTARSGRAAHRNQVCRRQAPQRAPPSPAFALS